MAVRSQRNQQGIDPTINNPVLPFQSEDDFQSNYNRHSKHRTKRRVGLDELQRVITELLHRPFPDNKDLYVIPEDENAPGEEEEGADFKQRMRKEEMRKSGLMEDARNCTSQSHRSNVSFYSSEFSGEDECGKPAQSRDPQYQDKINYTRPVPKPDPDQLCVDDARPTFVQSRPKFVENTLPALARNRGNRLLPADSPMRKMPKVAPVRMSANSINLSRVEMREENEGKVTGFDTRRDYGKRSRDLDISVRTNPEVKKSSKTRNISISSVTELPVLSVRPYGELPGLPTKPTYQKKPGVSIPRLPVLSSRLIISTNN